MLVDAGAMLYVKNSIIKNGRGQAEIYAEAIIKSKLKMGFSAIGIASMDLSMGIDYLKKVQKEFDFPWVSLNLVSTSDNNPIFSPYLHQKINGINIGILGLTGQNSITGVNSNEKFKILPWKDTLPTILNKNKKEFDLIILLSSFSLKVNKEIAKTHPEIHLLVQSGHQKNNIQPIIVNNTLITQTASMGKYLGVMDIKWNKSNKWEIVSSGKLSERKKELTRLDWQLNRLDKRINSQTDDDNETYKNMLKDKESLQLKIEQLNQDQITKYQNINQYNNRFIAIKTSLKEDKPIKAIVDSAKRASNNLLKKRFQLSQSKPVDQNFPLTGSNSCKKCHTAQYIFWEKTRHSKAWKTLVMENQQNNIECLVCHVTLHSRKKSNIGKLNQQIMNLSAKFRNVGCEECHASGKKHILQPKKYRPEVPNEQTCKNCHTLERDKKFNMQIMLPLIQCPTQ